MSKRIKGFEYLPIIIISIIIYKLSGNIEKVNQGFKFVLNMLIPFFWAFGFAYLINPIMVFIGEKFKLKRNMSMALSYLILIIGLSIGIAFIVPVISNSIYDIGKNAPEYAESVERFVDLKMSEFPILEQLNVPQEPDSKDITKIGSAIDKITQILSGMLSNLLLGIVGVTSNIFKVVIGLIISIYMLKDKELFIRGIKKMLFSFLDRDFAEKLCHIGVETNIMFSKYFIGKIIDSAIIAVICYAGMFLIKAPYPTLMALIIGVTNMIPFFGPFIGAVPAVLITLFTIPQKAIWVVAFIFLLQQFDGYVLGPKILGDSVGLSPFWIILAIIVGGGLFGVLGMLIAVPITALMRNAFIEFMNANLKKKNLDKYI